MEQINRPAVNYFGGKWLIAPWIIKHFPSHQNYLEPCCGAASVLLQKARSPLETINDIDDNVVNFLQVLRERRDELIEMIRLTPWARTEHERCRNPSDEPLENARRFYASAMMGFSRGPFDPTAGMHMITDARIMYSKTFCEISDENTGHLFAIAKRLQKVQIECRDCLEVIESFDNDAALIYFDPPYVHNKRTGKRGYRHEFAEEKHRECAELLKTCEGCVIVSGYTSELYKQLYESDGWKRIDKMIPTGRKISTESLWLSPLTQYRLSMQKELFTEHEDHDRHT